MRWLTLLVVVAVAAGCGNRTPHRVPHLTGERLDVAEDVLDRSGLGVNVEGGPVLIRSHWRVVAQTPGAGRRATKVTLYVEHDEDEYDD